LKRWGRASAPTIAPQDVSRSPCARRTNHRRGHEARRLRSCAASGSTDSAPARCGGTVPIALPSIPLQRRCCDRSIGSFGTCPRSSLIQWRTAATKAVTHGGALHGRYLGAVARISLWSARILASSAPFADTRCPAFNPPRTMRRRKLATRRLLRRPAFRALDKKTAADRIAVCSLNKTGGRKPDTLVCWTAGSGSERRDRREAVVRRLLYMARKTRRRLIEQRFELGIRLRRFLLELCVVYVTLIGMRQHFVR